MVINLKKLFFYTFSGILFLIICPIIGLVLFEGYKQYRNDDPELFIWKFPTEPLPISHKPVISLVSSPIKGLVPNLNYVGPAFWEESWKRSDKSHYKIKTNKFGFFTPFPVDNYPEKKHKEFRIILVGGSGAQGHGASSNAKMFYSQLEKRLNANFEKDGFEVRVINLGLAGMEAKQIAPILRTFGHRLKPDLILAYVGANDIHKYAGHQTKGLKNLCSSYTSYNLNANHIAPNWIKGLGRWFPHLMYEYGFARLIKRKLYFQTYKEMGFNECLSDLGIEKDKTLRLNQAIYNKFLVPLFIENFKAIKRDFCDIPILLAWQAIHIGERNIYNNLFKNNEYTSRALPPISFSAITKHGFNINKQTQSAVYYLITDQNARTPSVETLLSKGKILQNPSIGIPLNSLSNTLKNKALDITDLRVHFLVKDKKFRESVETNKIKVLTNEEQQTYIRRNDIYQNFYKTVKEKLRRYRNDYWYFSNIDWIANVRASKKLKENNSISIHLDNDGNSLVTQILLEKINPIITALKLGPIQPKCRN